MYLFVDELSSSIQDSMVCLMVEKVVKSCKLFTVWIEKFTS